MKLNTTYQPNIYYAQLSMLPNELQERVLNTETEYENSSYTTYQHGAFKRGEFYLDGTKYAWELTILSDNGDYSNMNETQFYALAKVVDESTEYDYANIYLTEIE